jgi:hypothetical protein
MNESAFPWQIDNGETMRGHKGMTLRDYFAAKALQGMLAETSLKATVEEFADKSYELADAMMKAREI